MSYQLGLQRRVLLPLTATVLLCGPTAHGQDGAAPKATWTPEACYKLKTIGSVQPSPDGKRILYTVSETVFDAESANEHVRLYAANADGTSAHALTKDGDRPSQPQWSPAGVCDPMAPAAKHSRRAWSSPRSSGRPTAA